VKVELSFVSKVKNFENLKRTELPGECRQKMSFVCPCVCPKKKRVCKK